MANKLKFLLGQYHSWLLTQLDKEPILVAGDQIEIQDSPLGSFLVLIHPESGFRRKIRSGYRKKEGRICLELEEEPGRESVPVLLTPREALLINPSGGLARYSFRKWARKLLENNFQEIRWQRVRFRENRAPSLSGARVCYLGRKMDGAMQTAMVMEYDLCPSALYTTLSAAVLWQAQLEKRNTNRKSCRHLLIVPERMLAPASRMLCLMDLRKVSWCLSGYRGQSLHLHPVNYLKTPLSIQTGSSRWPGSKPWHSNDLLNRIYREHPAGFRRFPRADGGSSFRFLGLELLRSHSLLESPLCFGPPDYNRELSAESLPEWNALIRQVQAIRRYDSPDKNHPYYRWQGERWLEERLLCHPRELDPEIDERFVYSQVPTRSGEHRGILDVLAVNREGRLVVVEIKVDRDPDLLYQALDYWERVHRHNLENEFENRGYFPGRILKKEVPLLYLTAPALSFPSCLKTQAELLRPGIPVYKIGIRGDWRRVLKVSFRERISP